MVSRRSLLESKLAEASQAYYSDGSSKMSDTEFDASLEELRKLDPESDVVKNVGHGYSVSNDTTYGVKKQHRYGLVGSLDKVHNWKELKQSLRTDDVVCSLKLDGISCVLYYDLGTFTEALTRGDGSVGIDISDKVRFIAPDITENKMDDGFTGAIRGELLMTRSNFARYSKVHTDAKNPRNTTAGLINKKDYDPEDIKYISLVVYTMTGSDVKFKKYEEMLQFLSNIHETVPYSTSYYSESEFIDHMSELNNEFKVYGYPSDGIVITNQRLNQLALGSSTYTIEYDSQAFKFPAERKETTVKQVEWNLSKTGYLVPKISFDTIELSGTSVSYATGFNAKYIKDNEIGTDTKLTVTKSGEIIPYIVDILEPTEAKLPDICPSCNNELEWNGVHLYCSNKECPNILIQDLVIWMKTIAPVDGLSDTLIQKFCDEFNLKCVDDIYELYSGFRNPHPESIQYCLFFKALNGCLNNTVDVATALRACNIPRFGDITCRKMNDYYDIVMEVLGYGRFNFSHVLKLTDAIGPANFQSLKNNTYKVLRLRYIEDRIIKKETMVAESKGDVCITGKLSVKRSVFEDELMSAGFNPAGSVKKTTMFLITDNPNSGSSKNKAADKYGIPKLTESEFRSTYLS